MADVHTKATRSYNMSRIRSKDTKPEILVRKFLFSKGFRFKLHDKNLPGKPDIVLPKYKTVILVDGCCWHGHKGCKYFVVPKTRTKWWMNKITTNKQHDSENKRLLTKAGWKVITLWECNLKKAKLDKTLLTVTIMTFIVIDLPGICHTLVYVTVGKNRIIFRKPYP